MGTNRARTEVPRVTRDILATSAVVCDRQVCILHRNRSNASSIYATVADEQSCCPGALAMAKPLRHHGRREGVLDSAGPRTWRPSGGPLLRNNGLHLRPRRVGTMSATSGCCPVVHEAPIISAPRLTPSWTNAGQARKPQGLPCRR